MGASSDCIAIKMAKQYYRSMFQRKMNEQGTETEMDDYDRQIIRLLEHDGRMTVTNLAAQVGLTPPSVRDRIRRMEDKGVISGFTVTIDPQSLGFELAAVVRIKPRPGNLHVVERMIVEEPRFVSCDKVTGDDCFIARLLLKNIQELDTLLDAFHEKAETNTAIVKSSPVTARLPTDI